ncbi:MAG TPA: hypothetical protein VHG33_03875 [Woeseiaceae bacterium]|nr:hypothetical protein [Woeseiaceae bacterium]
MDDIDTRLKRDAEAIRADVPPELTSRIRAAIDAQARPPAEARKTITSRKWLAASLGGAAAAVLVVALLPRDAERLPETPVARDVPAYVERLDRALPLQVEKAEFTAPLEQELQNLQADLEKARRSVAEDIAF